MIGGKAKIEFGAKTEKICILKIISELMKSVNNLTFIVCCIKYRK
jgi:hypothetical protein